MREHKIYGLNVTEHGENNSQAIIFIHAFPLCNRMWDPQAEYFKTKYRVVVYDLRGFGHSEINDGQFPVDSHVDDLNSIIDKLNINKPIICGLSMGGYIALRALEMNQDKFKAVILSDTKAEADANAAKIKRAEQIKLIKSGGKNNFFEGFINNALSESTLKGNEEKQKIVKFLKEMMGWQSDTGICAGLMTLAARTDTTDSLEKVKIPALILVGENDKLVPPEFSKLMNEKITNSKLERIPESGHFPNLENPEAFNRAIENFIENL
ncbi:MAG: alpha/beta fold hydrolase [Ignavibacteria bacterium]